MQYATERLDNAGIGSIPAKDATVYALEDEVHYNYRKGFYRNHQMRWNDKSARYDRLPSSSFPECLNRTSTYAPQVRRM